MAKQLFSRLTPSMTADAEGKPKVAFGFTTEHWIPFIARKFREGEKVIADDAIQGVCKLTEGHPFYTQHFLYAAFVPCALGTLRTR